MKRLSFFILLSLFIPASLLAGHIEEYLKILKSYNPDMKITGTFKVNSPILITNLSERISGSSAIESARGFIKKYGSLFYLGDKIDLILDKEVGGKDLRTVRFKYTYNGYPVYPAGVAITVDSMGSIKKISFFDLSIGDLDTRAAFNREDAYYLVLNKYAPFTNIVGARYNDNSVREVVLLIGKQAFFVYEVKVASIASMTNTSYFIEARSGRLLFKRNNVFTLNRARIYDPNPGIDGKGELVEVEIVNLDPNVTDKTLTGTLIRGHNCYGKGEQKEWAIPQYQSTMKFSVCNVGPKAKSDENGDFYLTPDDPVKCFNPEDSQACFESVMEDDFAELMLYYHANKMYAYFKGRGFDIIKTNSGNPSLMALANFKLPNFYELQYNCIEDPNNQGWKICTTDKFMPFDNAAFMPYDGSFDDFGIHDDAIVFGQGEKVDFAYDAEVTYHEFTHAMIGSTCNLTYAYVDAYGMYIDPGAMNEGFADYFSSTVSGDPKVGEYVSNATENPGSLRDLNISARCPDDLWGESHNDGILLSSALWKIRTEFVKDYGNEDLFDQKVYDTLVSLSEIATFSDFSNALVAALKNDTNIGQSFADKAEGIFKENNILNCERLVNLENGKYLLFVEGMDIVGFSPYVPGYLQFYYDMPENTLKFMLDMDIYSNSMMGGSDAEIRVLMKKDNPVEFDITLNGDVSSNSDFELTANNNHFEVSSPQIEGGHRYYIAFVNYGGAQGILQSITPSVEMKQVEEDAGVDAPGDASVTDIVVEDTSDDITLLPDEGIADVSDAVILDTGTQDTGIQDSGVKDTGIVPDVVVIDGSSKVESSDESGCSCSVIE